MNWCGSTSKPILSAGWRSPTKRISRPRSAHPCANYRTTRRKSVPSTKSHPLNTPHENEHTYGLINTAPPTVITLTIQLTIRHSESSCRLNNPGASTAPLSSPAQASPSMRGFTPPVTVQDRIVFVAFFMAFCIVFLRRFPIDVLIVVQKNHEVLVSMDQIRIFY